MFQLFDVNKSQLSRRLLFYVVICAFIFSIFSTVVLMIISHTRSLSSLESTFNYIESGFAEGIAASLYALDEDQLKLQLNGVLNFPYVELVTVTEERGEKQVLFDQGESSTPRDLVRMFPLIYKPPSKEPIYCGELSVVLNLGELYSNIWQEGLITFSTSVLGLGIVSFCIFLIFQFGLTRHLVSMCKFADKLNLNQLDTNFELNRRTPILWGNDELQQLAFSLNKMRRRLNTDLHEFQRREEKLLEYTESLRLYEHIISSTNDLMSFIDRKYRYKAVNKAYLVAHKKKREEIINCSVDQLMGAETFTKVVKVQLDRSFAGDIVQYQNWFEYAGLGRRYMDVAYHPFIAKNSDIIGVVVVAHDMTELKESELESNRLKNQLQQAQKMEAIGTLAGGIAHDFNNILGAIIGFTELARDESQPGSLVIKDLEQVLEAANRAKNLVQQILAFSSQTNSERVVFSPASLVKETLKMLGPTIPSSIEIIQDIDTEASCIVADPTQINQVLLNLCTNAYHALEETGGQFCVSVKEKILTAVDLKQEPGVEAGTFIQLSVKDSGPGISPSIKSKIFDPYFTTKETGKGTGMGLSIAHGIVKSHGGFILLESELEKGATFHVFLPVGETSVMKAAQVVTDDRIPIGEERILFVDDEETLGRMGQKMLERLGYRVTFKNNSLEALELFKNQAHMFDLVITDQTMPGMTGAELSRRLLQIRPDIPIILCTGYSSILNREKAEAIGIREFALKPIAKKDISQLIRKAIDRKNG